MCLKLFWAGLVLLVLAACSTSGPDIVEPASVERGEASLILRYAVNASDRHPQRLFRRMIREGTLPYTNGYLPPHSPGGPVVMDCGHVDAFGVVFSIDWTGRNDRRAKLRVSHPEIRNGGGSFFGDLYPPRGLESGLKNYEWEIKLWERIRRDGLFTIEVTQDDETLLQVEFLMEGCEDRAGVSQARAEGVVPSGQDE